MPTAPPLVYYITAHGYGHGTRSCSILQAFREHCPEIPVEIVTDLPASFLHNRLGGKGYRLRSGAFDVGMVQLDSIRVDLPATLQKVGHLHAGADQRVADEQAWLEQIGAGLVVADIPALPLEAAARAGIPALAVGNFTWDWIYRAFLDDDPAWEPHIQRFREAYAHADLLLRLPFSDEMDAFPRQAPLAVVSRPGRDRREAMARSYGIDPDLRWVLLSFTSLDWDAEALARVTRLPGTLFFTVQPLAWDVPNFVAVDREDFSFSETLASCDLVVSKPGFGIVSECAVSAKPLVYADRSDFAEYPILVDAIQRHLCQVHIPAAKLYRGELTEALEAIEQAPAPPEPVERGGDVQAVEHFKAWYRGSIAKTANSLSTPGGWS